MIKKIKCPMCEKKVQFDDKEKLPPNFPFCSKRCKLIDLGKWLNEEYTISDPITEESLEESLLDDDGK
jgi:endogenous inhibitor of DNA gyrase (YacG/DUF329 family)